MKGISPKNFVNNNNPLAFTSAWMLGQPSPSTNICYIKKQIGPSKYIVTDGTISGICSLSPDINNNNIAPNPGTCLLAISTPFNTIEHVRKLLYSMLYTFEDSTYKILTISYIPPNIGTNNLIDFSSTVNSSYYSFI